MEMMDKYLNDEGKVGVIVSPGYGAGWSSWNDEHREFLAMDSELIALKLSGGSADEAEQRFLSVFGEDAYIYTGGWDEAKVEWLHPGTKFRISEHDGSESLVELSLEEYLTA